MSELLRVPPTRSVLLRLRRHRETLVAARDLLDRKRQILAQKVVELLPHWQELHGKAYPSLLSAYESYSVTRMRSTAAELDRTIVLLRDATESLARLAAVAATLRSLVRSLRKTNRQVRTLSDRLIPLYEATIRSIAESLDEQERSYLFQLKRLR